MHPCRRPRALKREGPIADPVNPAHALQVPSSYQLVFGPVLWAMTMAVMPAVDSALQETHSSTPKPHALYGSQDRPLHQGPAGPSPATAAVTFLLMACLPYAVAVMMERAVLLRKYDEYVIEEEARGASMEASSSKDGPDTCGGGGSAGTLISSSNSSTPTAAADSRGAGVGCSQDAQTQETLQRSATTAVLSPMEAVGRTEGTEAALAAVLPAVRPLGGASSRPGGASGTRSGCSKDDKDQPGDQSDPFAPSAATGGPASSAPGGHPPAAQRHIGSGGPGVDIVREQPRAQEPTSGAAPTWPSHLPTLHSNVPAAGRQGPRASLACPMINVAQLLAAHPRRHSALTAGVTGTSRDAPLPCPLYRSLAKSHLMSCKIPMAPSAGPAAAAGGSTFQAASSQALAAARTAIHRHNATDAAAAAAATSALGMGGAHGSPDVAASGLVSPAPARRMVPISSVCVEGFRAADAPCEHGAVE